MFCNRHFWVPGLLVPTQRGQVQRGVALVVLGVDVQTSAALHDGTAALGALGDMGDLGDGSGGVHRRSKSSKSLDETHGFWETYGFMDPTHGFMDDHFGFETHGVLGSINP